MPHPQTDVLSRKPVIDVVLHRVTRPLAFAGVLGMLAVAGVTVVAVLLRWSGLGGLAAMNEITGMLFAVAIAATLPAATAQRVHLRIDLLGGMMGPRLRRLMDLLGSLLLLLFLTLLAREVYAYSGRLISGGARPQYWAGRWASLCGQWVYCYGPQWVCRQLQLRWTCGA